MLICNQFGIFRNTSRAKETIPSSTVCQATAALSVLSEEQSWVLMLCDSHTDKTVSGQKCGPAPSIASYIYATMSAASYKIV